jgi:hypothetical protein
MPRRTIEELVNLYALEPTLRDIFVEGQFDAKLIRWFLYDRSLSNAVVYEIDTVEVDGSLLDDFGLTSGNKQRIIALLEAVNRSLPAQRQARGLVDADTDRLLEKPIVTESIFVSDYASLGAYFLKPTIVKKWLLLAVGLGPDLYDQWCLSIGSVCSNLFLIRAAANLMGGSVGWMSIDAGFSNERPAPRDLSDFQYHQFVTKLLNKYAQLSRAAEFHALIEELRTKMDPDARNSMNDHDFFALLVIYVKRNTGQKWLHSEQAVCASLLQAVTRDDLSNEHLFQDIYDWACTA